VDNAKLFKGEYDTVGQKGYGVDKAIDKDLLVVIEKISVTGP